MRKHAGDARGLTSALRGLAARALALVGLLAGLLVWAPVAARAALASTTSSQVVAASVAAQGIEVDAASTKVVGAASMASAEALVNLGQAPSVAPRQLVAEGSGQLLPSVAASSQASLGPGGVPQGGGTVCAAPALPSALSSLLTVGIACGASGVSAQTGSYAGSSSASVGTVSVGLGALTGSLPAPLSSVVSSLQQELSSLGLQASQTIPVSQAESLLSQALSQATGSGSGALPAPLGAALSTVSQAGSQGVLVGSLSQLLSSAAQVGTLLTASIGPTQTTIQISSDGTTVASATASGTQVDLLPGLGAQGAPLVKVSLGPASISVTVPTGGSPTMQPQAAVATVTVSPPGAQPQTLTLGPGQSMTFFQGTPLESSIVLGASSVQQDPSSSQGSAEGLVVSLATPVSGGLRLVLGSLHASADSQLAGRASPITTSPPTLPPVTGATSTHTGAPWAGSLPVAAGAGVAGALSWLVGPRIRRHLRVPRSGRG
jgi:hypothetical protein